MIQLKIHGTDISGNFRIIILIRVHGLLRIFCWFHLIWLPNTIWAHPQYSDFTLFYLPYIIHLNFSLNMVLFGNIIVNKRFCSLISICLAIYYQFVVEIHCSRMSFMLGGICPCRSYRSKCFVHTFIMCSYLFFVKLVPRSVSLPSSWFLFFFQLISVLSFYIPSIRYITIFLSFFIYVLYF